MRNGSRREFIAWLPVVAAAAPIAASAQADDGFERPDDIFAQRRLKETHPQAIELGYVRDATRVDRAKFTAYVPGQSCASCAIFGAATGSTWGNCYALPGAIASTGWCTKYEAKKS